jgi:ABC-2 type transport system permease protein
MSGGVDWPVVRAIFYKDVLASRRSKSVYLPILLVPLALLVVLPALLAFFARYAQTPDLSSLLDRFPGSLSRELAKMPPNRQLIELVLGYLAAPLFLVVPMMVSTALAADALAGEKERRTLESLLHLPIQMKELFLAKIGFAFIPSLVVSWVGFLLYAITVNLIAWPIMGRIFVPNMRWGVLIVVVAPAVAAVGLGVMVRVSARANSSQEANQLGGAVIVPLILASVGQTSTLLLLAPQWILLSGIVIWLVAAILIHGGMKRFTRDRVASRL